MPDPAPNPSLRPVAVWLASVYVAVCAMVLLGGTVRLTGSGLSMVEWRPLMGALPPMGQDAWQAVFAAYQESPQYLQVNSWMDLAAFKRIFFWEYLHRVVGRGLGLVFFVPWLWFLLRRRLSGRDAGRTAVAFVLGGLQGVLGWYMVASGLVDRPEVSHYRLAAHLSLALVVACYLLWLTLDFGQRSRPVPTAPPRHPGEARIRRLTWALLGLVFVQVVWGAFMAGTRAGLLFPTWPTFGGAWIPPGCCAVGELASDPVAIHVVHRWLGTALVALVLAWGWLARSSASTASRRWALVLSAAVVAAQFTLGVATVLAGVPAWLGVAHQGGGVALLSILLYAAFAWRGLSGGATGSSPGYGPSKVRTTTT